MSPSPRRHSVLTFALALGAALLACSAPPDDGGGDTSTATVVGPEKAAQLEAKLRDMVNGTDLGPASQADLDEARAALDETTRDQLRALVPSSAEADRDVASTLVARAGGKHGTLLSRGFHWGDKANKTAYIASVNYVRSPTGETLVIAERDAFHLATPRSITREFFVFDKHNAGISGGVDHLASRDREVIDETNGGSTQLASLELGLEPQADQPKSPDEAYVGNVTLCNACIAFAGGLRFLSDQSAYLGAGAVAAGLREGWSISRWATGLCTLVGVGAGVATGVATGAAVTAATAETGPAAPVLGAVSGIGNGVSKGQTAFKWCTGLLWSAAAVILTSAAINQATHPPVATVDRLKWCNAPFQFFNAEPICMPSAPRHCRPEFVLPTKAPGRPAGERCATAMLCAIDGVARRDLPCKADSPEAWCKSTLVMTDSEQDTKEVKACVIALDQTCRSPGQSQSGIDAICKFALEQEGLTPSTPAPGPAAQ